MTKVTDCSFKESNNQLSLPLLAHEQPAALKGEK